MLPPILLPSLSKGEGRSTCYASSSSPVFLPGKDDMAVAASERAPSVKAVEVERWGGWSKCSAQMISLASPKKCSISPSHTPSFPPLLPPSGVLTKETWLSQRPAADLLIHSLCPFYVLLQTYLQRGRSKGRGKEVGKDLKSARVVHITFFA